MKKLLTLFCCILYMHTIAGPAPDIKIVSQRASGEKILVKAFVAIVNRDNAKKKPVKRTNLPASESK
jgi:hypothetical protein